jgi:hypothetical protein
MASSLGLLCFSIPGLALLGAGILFIFARDSVWNWGQNKEGVIPDQFDRHRRWNLQMISIGIMLLMLGLLCLGLSGVALLQQ